MDLAPDSDQQALVDATANWCAANLPLVEARNRPANVWADLEAMGWLAMTTSDTGFGHATEALVFAELGRHLAPVGMISTAVVNRWTSTPGKAALALKESVGGASSLRAFDPQGAECAVAWSEGSANLFALPRDLEIQTGLDQTAPMARVSPAPAGMKIDDPRVGLHLQLLAASLAVGCADAACDMAAAYARMREQFDRPIGWFQSLKHMCADMAVRCEVARSQLMFAACTLDTTVEDTAFHIASAKFLADRAAIENGRANIQVHGGIGMTDEAFPHLCLKRAHLLSFIAPAGRAIILGKAA